MGEVQDPQARIGGAHTGGPNPYPGGTTDTGDVDLPPYEGRSTGPGDSESTRERTDSVERMLQDTASEGEAEVGKVSGGDGAENVDPSTGEAGEPISAGEVSSGGGSETPDPHGVGESDSQRGESFEAPATEHQGPTQRPVGQVEGDLMEPNNSGSGTSDVD